MLPYCAEMLNWCRLRSSRINWKSKVMISRKSGMVMIMLVLVVVVEVPMTINCLPIDRDIYILSYAKLH